MADAILADVNASGIYQIRNLKNGKRYIGSACNLRRRKVDHYKMLRGGRHHSRYLQAAWRKYGEPFFCFEHIEIVADVTKLVEREQHYFDTHSPEYNICRVAGSPLGMRHTEASKAKMSLSRKGRKLSKEHVDSIRKANLGRKWTEEQRIKMGVALRRRSNDQNYIRMLKERAENLSADPEHGRKISAALKGRASPTKGMKRNPDAVERTASAHRGMKRSAETCRRISEARKGKKLKQPRSAEYRAKISAAHKGRILSPEHMAALQAGRIARRITPEQRAATSASVRLAYETGRHTRHVSDECKDKLGRHFAKLTDDQVREIRDLRSSGMTGREVASTYGSNPGTISDICSGKRYRWVQ